MAPIASGKDVVSVQFHGPSSSGSRDIEGQVLLEHDKDSLTEQATLTMEPCGQPVQPAQRFSALCRRLGINSHAEAAWIDATHQPSGYLAAMIAANTAIIGLRVWLFVGAQGMQFEARVSLQFLAVLNVVSDTGLVVLMWQFGPSFHDGHPIITKILTLGAYLGSMPVYFVPLLAPERLVPFQSRFEFLICMAGSTIVDVIIGDFLINPTERPARHVTVWKYLTDGAFKSIRAVDAFSDMIYLRVLWEKVCVKISSQIYVPTPPNTA